MITLGKKQEKEEIAYILDYLHYGRSDDSRPMYQKKPLIQAVGEKHFVLMELIPKDEAVPNVQDKVYIGDGDRPVIDHVKRRISYNELTHGAQLELPSVIEKIVLANETRFLSFFNDAYPITTRLHMLELLPGIGKKLMWGIIEVKKKGKFESFKNLVERVKGLHAPEKLIAHRVMDELKEDNIKYRVFTTPMPPKR
jgi:putative nucleotide binding protein